LSWSQTTSKAVALALSAWLPDVLQEVRPWMSERDIEAGEPWLREVETHLGSAEFAIICVTAENYQRPWLNYEAGAMAERLKGKTCPYLLNVEPNFLERTPLSRLQAVQSTKDGTKKLIDAINRKLSAPLPDARRDKAFETHWAELDAKLKAIEPDTPVATRSTDSKVEETLAIVQELSLRIARNEYGWQFHRPRWRALAERLEKALIRAGALPGVFDISPDGETEEGFRISGQIHPMVYLFGFSEALDDASLDRHAARMVEHLQLTKRAAALPRP